MTWIGRQAARALPTVADAADRLAGALSDPAREQRSALAETAHRPWPLPERPWVMGQTWLDLLFAHWPVPVHRLRGLLPPALAVDRFDDAAWISVTPFAVVGTRARGAPPPPALSRFPELNVRTYVTFAGRPGIWFFSLDAARAAAVAAARALYRLPYFRARMAIHREADGVRYTSERTDPHGEPARFAARYRPAGDPQPAAPGTLDAWLVERYRLYTAAEDGRLLAADIHHRPWALQPAAAAIDVNTMASPMALDLSGPPVLRYARRQDVLFWPLVAAEED
jgi:uncharacterized protein YqjF (DUF2071 family)